MPSGSNRSGPGPGSQRSQHQVLQFGRRSPAGSACFEHCQRVRCLRVIARRSLAITLRCDPSRRVRPHSRSPRTLHKRYVGHSVCVTSPIRPSFAPRSRGCSRFLSKRRSGPGKPQHSRGRNLLRTQPWRSPIFSGFSRSATWSAAVIAFSCDRHRKR
jgi:hypothetical protein